MNAVNDRQSKRAEKHWESIAAPKRIAIACGKSLAITLLFIIAALFITAWAVYSDNDPDKLVIPAGHGLLTASALLCGFIASKICGTDNFLCGIIAGAVLMLIMSVLSTILNGSNTLTGVFPILTRLSVPAISGFGGLLSLYKRKNIRRKHRRRK